MAFAGAYRSRKAPPPPEISTSFDSQPSPAATAAEPRRKHNSGTTRKRGKVPSTPYMCIIIVCISSSSHHLTLKSTHKHTQRARGGGKQSSLVFHEHRKERWHSGTALPASASGATGAGGGTPGGLSRSKTKVLNKALAARRKVLMASSQSDQLPANGRQYVRQQQAGAAGAGAASPPDDGHHTPGAVSASSELEAGGWLNGGHSAAGIGGGAGAGAGNGSTHSGPGAAPQSSPAVRRTTALAVASPSTPPVWQDEDDDDDEEVADNAGRGVAATAAPRRSSNKWRVEASVLDAATAHMLHHKLRAAAYVDGGADYDRLFDTYDRDHNGILNFDEFRTAVRRHGAVPARVVSDKALRRLFNAVAEGDGEVDVGEFIDWLANEQAAPRQQPPPPPPPPTSGASSSASSAAATRMRRASSFARRWRLVDGSIEATDQLKLRLQAAAYNTGRLDFSWLFRRYTDRGEEGQLEWDAFRSALRRDGRVAPKEVSDTMVTPPSFDVHPRSH